MPLIKTKLTSEQAVLPCKTYPTDAGNDLTISESRVLAPNRATKLHTGCIVEIPTGYYGEIKPRSSTMFRHGIIVVDGTIDSSYRGEIMISVYNPNSHEVHLEKGSKIAQLVVCPCLLCDFIQVDDVSDTDRGENGFGSTGK